LVFTRKLDQTVIIAGFITVKLTWIEDRTAHVEVLAPRDVPLWPTQGAKVVALN
jgi:sRNA-binding carbon storage regulator CsrA